MQVDDSADSEEARPPQIATGPEAPTEREIEEHEALGHVVHRSWCKYCVQARAAENPHYKAPETPENAVATIMLDYAFMGQDDEETTPLLIMKDSKYKTIWATTILQKGAESFAVKSLVNAVRESGHRKVIMKSDDEASIIALKNAARGELADVEIIMKESPEPSRRSPSEW